ncbi:SusC/RagA family TonB-linked outer membrane protein [Pedobacter nyackensis]|uniref:SusC/RagA family TonB-linked outer membrane protein n=1 Tax=Pedobacter nyackensis TaxID=475255 RepID=UPI00292CA617|nr:SusC/RagA family TonB-linked outer membrane protein [Pedobacter nyackensis]
MQLYTFNKGVLLDSGVLRQIVLVMKVTTLLIFAFLMQVCAAGLAQKITLNERNASLESVMDKIRSQTGYEFVFNVKDIDNAKRVNVSFKAKELNEALEKLFQNQALSFSVKDKFIVVKPKMPSFLENVIARLVDIDVRGKVIGEDDQVLVGATVKVKGTSKSVSTDVNGEFYLQGVDEGATVIVAYVGYINVELPATKMMGIIKLKMGSSDLQEVTINKGYYSTKKAFNTGNVSTVKSEDLARQPISDPIAALQGRVPGLFIQQTSGVLGRSMNIRLRGQNSLANGNDPLYIIDGIPFISEPLTLSGINDATGKHASPFNSLNINDIEKIEVLKDADATAIYGSRGANGVILITTKKGASNTDKLAINVYSGVGEVARRLEFLNLEEYIAMRTKAFENDNILPRATDYDLNGTWEKNKYTDWQDFFIGGTATVNDFQASLSGGNSNTHYRIGGTYRKETTVYPGDFFGRKAGFTMNLNHQSANERLSFNLSANYINNFNNLPISDFTNSISIAPNAPEVYNSDGSLNWANQTWANPLTALFTKAKENSNNLIGNFQVNYKILKDLEFKTTLGYNKLDFQQNNITPFSAINPSFLPASIFRTNDIATNRNNSWIIEPQLSYNKSFWKGELNILVGSTILGTGKTALAENVTGFSTDALIENIAAGTYRTILNNSDAKYRYNALFTRIGYAINDKYVFNLTARRDGSSRFGPDKRFGNFGAIGAAWVFSEENFIKKNISFISFGKIRGSYGITGNDQIGDYEYLSAYTSYAIAYQGVPSLEPTQHTNPLYGWERVDKIEVGLELGLFNDRLLLSSSFYRNRTKNQLVDYALPAITGFSIVKANLSAVLQNSGLELETSGNIIKTTKFLWNANINITFPKNKLISYPNIKSSSFANRYAVGQPLSLSYLYSYTGIDPQTGLYTFKDANNDGAVTSTFDREFYFIGQKYFGGLQNNIEYKNFQLNFLIQFTKQSAQDFNQSFTAGLFNSGNSNIPKSALDGGRQELSQTTSGLKRTRQNLFTNSNGLITDASFLRLKNVALSWKVPVSKGTLSFVHSFRLYIQGQNLLTFTKYEGFDPDMGRSSSYGMPSIRMMTAGMQIAL